jgi:hypothetical protein
MPSIRERELYQHITEEHIDSSSGLGFTVQPEEANFSNARLQFSLSRA